MWPRAGSHSPAHGLCRGEGEDSFGNFAESLQVLSLSPLLPWSLLSSPAAFLIPSCSFFLPSS